MSSVAAIAACLAVIMFASCKKEEVKKTVTVGEQVGALFTGTAGTATFTVTTENIATGSAITLNNTVAGISLGTTATTGNSTTVSINTTAATPQGAHPLTLTIDGKTSAAFTLNVGGAKTVKVIGEQVGKLEAGFAGTVTYTIETANIANATYTVEVANRPTGVTVQGQVKIDNNSGTLTLAGGTTTKAGTTDNLTLTIDGITSGAFTLKIDEPIFLLEEKQSTPGHKYVYEYDNKDRITKITIYYGSGQFYGFTTYTYDPTTGDLIESEWEKPYDEGSRTITREGNIINIINVTLNDGEWTDIIELNAQGLPEKYTCEYEDGSKYIAIYTWENGNQTEEKVEGGASTTFTYDNNTKTPFHYSKTPKWVLWMFEYSSLFHNVNNVKTVRGVTYVYDYNEYGLPVERTGGGTTETYKYMKR